MLDVATLSREGRGFREAAIVAKRGRP